MKKVDLTTRTPDEKSALLAQMHKGQELAGHFPDDQDDDRFLRLLNGDITVTQAYAEVYRELGIPERAPIIAPTP